MTQKQSTDFLLERRLKELDPELHTCYRNSVFAMDRLLANYKMVFPFFTNHTFEHSEQVINYCNVIAGPENVARLNRDEVYILLMGASLHDIGMGISQNDFQVMSEEIPAAKLYKEAHPEAPIGEITRAFHQEFSASFIRKYAALFEIPTEEHLYCICQIARGHRKMNFMDLKEFDPRYTLPGGNTVRLPYLAAVVKLADELDLTADRNLLIDYNSVLKSMESHDAILCYRCHQALKSLDAEEDAIVLHYETDDPETRDEIIKLEGKARKTFREYADVLKIMTDFTMQQSRVEFRNDGAQEQPV